MLWCFFGLHFSAATMLYSELQSGVTYQILLASWKRVTNAVQHAPIHGMGLSLYLFILLWLSRHNPPSCIAAQLRQVLP